MKELFHGGGCLNSIQWFKDKVLTAIQKTYVHFSNTRVARFNLSNNDCLKHCHRLVKYDKKTVLKSSGSTSATSWSSEGLLDADEDGNPDSPPIMSSPLALNFTFVAYIVYLRFRRNERVNLSGILVCFVNLNLL